MFSSQHVSFSTSRTATETVSRIAMTMPLCCSMAKMSVKNPSAALISGGGMLRVIPAPEYHYWSDEMVKLGQLTMRNLDGSVRPSDQISKNGWLSGYG